VARILVIAPLQAANTPTGLAVQRIKSQLARVPDLSPEQRLAQFPTVETVSMVDSGLARTRVRSLSLTMTDQ
jgi:hypothetical protein